MATLSNDGKSVTVVKGDTLWGIATTHASRIAGNTTQDKINTMVKLNNITNPNIIVIGQVIKLSGASSSDKNTANTNRATIKAFGIQSNTDRTMYATWTWSKNNTEHYEIEWYYGTGDGVWFIGSDTTTKDKQSTYSAPSNAIKVKFKVKPIAKTRKVDKKDKPYWTASWSTEKVHTFTYTLDVPSGLSAEVTGKPGNFNLKAELENVSGTATEIEFEVLQNNKTKLSGANKAKITNGYASYTWPITAGNEYKIRCRAVKNKQISEWSNYVTVDTPPADIKGIKTLKARTMTSVYIDWDNVSNAEEYEVQYTTDERDFDKNPSIPTVTIDAKTGGDATITGLGSGAEYFFRVRAKKGSQYSGWTEIKSVILGTEPSAPTTWSTTTTAIVNEWVYLYWTHNTEDGSKQTEAELELWVYFTDDESEGEQHIIDIYDKPDDYGDEDAKEESSYSYKLTTSDYDEGAKIKWRIRTAGITEKWSDWSIQRIIDVYAKPTVEMSVVDAISGYYIETLTSFPFKINCTTQPSTQQPIGYHLSITADEAYTTVDQVGNFKMVNVGEVVYSQYFDINSELSVQLSADNVDLENNISYTITCVASMNSGLTAETTYKFKVAWEDAQHEPSASISINEEDLSATIRPYLSKKCIHYYLVVHDHINDVYNVKERLHSTPYGISVDGAYTPNGDIVYKETYTDGSYMLFCMIDSEEEELIEGVTLSVYRREFDGSFTKIIDEVENTHSTYFHDPHPALDYARYRVVATTSSTGAVSYYDVPGIPVGEKAVVIQWDDEWTSFDTLNEDEMEERPSSCSMLKLPYNIDVSDKYGVDVSLIEYIGRKRPVSYYGTQLGESSTWNVVIEKDDEETLYALRRLAIWPGDVYVREPSGSGYWANITVSFSQKHCDLTIPVTLDIVRVEGGV